MAHQKQRLPRAMGVRQGAPMAEAVTSLRMSRAITLAVPVVVSALGLALLLLPVAPAIALLLGAAIALTIGNPLHAHTKGLAHRTLTWSVVGLGAGMDLVVVGRLGLHGLGVTVVGIGFALIFGTFLGRRLGVARDVSLLLCVGTAICGGSAIAAVAPAIRAKEHDISVALGVVFLLNAVALFVFPGIGHVLSLSQNAFGLWCALAIHDTSSVVGAAAQYGQQALEVATATKLARALWIVPVTFGVGAYRARLTPRGATTTEKPKLPWFIAGFLAVAALVTYVPELRGVGRIVSFGAHRLLNLTLFLVGLGFSRAALRTVGIRPLLQALGLWFVLGGSTLVAILFNWLN